MPRRIGDFDETARLARFNGLPAAEDGPMDIATIIGLVSTFTLVAIGFEDQPGRMIDTLSLILVVLGTMTTLLTSFPLSDLVYAPFQALRHPIIPSAGLAYYPAIWR